MTKITFIISDLGSGGAQKIMTELIHYWADKDRDISIITLDNGANDFFTLPDNIKRIALDEIHPASNAWQRLTHNARRVRKIRKALKTLKTETLISFIAPTNILAILATRGTNIRLIISERNDPSRQSFGRMWDFLRQKLYCHADMITANSNIAINTMARYVPQNKLRFIPNQLTPPDPRYIRPYDQKENIILAVGRLHPQKGFDVLLQAFARIHLDHPGWKLVIIGHGALEEELKALSKTIHIESKVLFTGQIKNPYEHYASAKIFALPSRHEGTPNALLEAMSCGVCPITSDAAEGALDFIQAKNQIFMTENPQDLAEKLTSLINNENQLMILGQAAKDAVQPLNSDKIFKQWEGII